MSATSTLTLPTTQAWSLEEAGDGVFFLTLDVPGERVNVLKASVLEELERVLDGAARNSAIKALVVRGGKPDTGTFIAGADIHEILAVTKAEEGSEKARRGQQIFSKLAAMPAVTIAAIHGNCLGGGTELALACDLRIASHSPKTRIGLPEVQLGILPGFGGTQRLPRRVGILNALPIILTGKPLSVEAAAKIGLVDAVVYPDLLREEAKALANHALLHGGKRYRPSGSRGRSFFARALERLPWGRAWIRRQARKNIMRVSGTHYPAPFRALDAVIDGFPKSLADGLALEASLVGELIASPVSKNLMALFLASEESRRGKRVDAADGGSEAAPAASRSTADLPTCGARGRIGVLGAGVMGGGIAALLAQKGYRVRLKDITPEALQVGLRKAHDLFSDLVRKRRISRRDPANYMASISPTTDDSGFEGVSAVIEAVVENLEVKKKVLQELETRLSPAALILTNTSALPITQIQAGLARPARVAGLHFFNPVHKMPLVEIVRGRDTAEETLLGAESLARELGKIPVRVEDAPGFLVNRLLAPYLNEAVRLLEEGYSPLAVDAALRAFGMPMGPFELLDEVGLDVAAKVATTLHSAFGDRAKPPTAMARLVDAKVLGKKGGKGFYNYSSQRLPWRKKPALNRDVLNLAGRGSAAFLPDSPEQWVRRLVYPMINEAARALEERVVDRPSKVDLAMVLGTGFAPFRGGPLRYADSVGLAEVVSFLEGTKQPRLQPCELLTRLAREGGKFQSLESPEVVLAHGSAG